MNLTSKRVSLQKLYYPIAYALYKLKAPPNFITFLSLLLGTASALAYYYEFLLTGFFLFFISGILDLADGLVARLSSRTTKFGAVFDWLVDKWIDGLVLGIVGYYYASPTWATFAVTLSMLHSFIKPVAYAEIGFMERINGKIIDPLEGKGFFGRPETHATLLFFTLLEKLEIEGSLELGIKLITFFTFLSLLHRLYYLYLQYGKVKDE